MSKALSQYKVSLPEIFDRIDATIEVSIKKKSPDAAMDMVGNLAEMRRTSGVALAYALGRLSKRWSELGMQESFIDSVIIATTLDSSTIGRYIRAGLLLERQPKFIARPVQDVIAIAQAEGKHGKFRPAQMEEISKTASTRDLRKVLGRLTGRANGGKIRLNIQLKRDGSLWGWYGKRDPIFIGHLLNSAEDMAEPLRAEAINRIILSAGLIVE